MSLDPPCAQMRKHMTMKLLVCTIEELSTYNTAELTTLGHMCAPWAYIFTFREKKQSSIESLREICPFRFWDDWYLAKYTSILGDALHICFLLQQTNLRPGKKIEHIVSFWLSGEPGNKCRINELLDEELLDEEDVRESITQAHHVEADGRWKLWENSESDESESRSACTV